MPKLIPNKFTSYELTPEETRIGFTFSELNIAVLQNELALASEARLGLMYDPSKPMEFVQSEAYNKGKIELLSFLLETSKQFAIEDIQTAQAMAAADNGNEGKFVVDSAYSIFDSPQQIPQ